MEEGSDQSRIKGGREKVSLGSKWPYLPSRTPRHNPRLPPGQRNCARVGAGPAGVRENVPPSALPHVTDTERIDGKYPQEPI